jgi:hypothetical protein
VKFGGRFSLKALRPSSPSFVVWINSGLIKFCTCHAWSGGKVTILRMRHDLVDETEPQHFFDIDRIIGHHHPHDIDIAELFDQQAERRPDVRGCCRSQPIRR